MALAEYTLIRLELFVETMLPVRGSTATPSGPTLAPVLLTEASVGDIRRGSGALVAMGDCFAPAMKGASTCRVRGPGRGTG